VGKKLGESFCGGKKFNVQEIVAGILKPLRNQK
jgi:hypothetical protein